MLVSNLLLAIAVIAALWGVVSMIFIANALDKRGFKINWLFLKVLIIKYIGQYRDVTRQETGKVGPWFYSFVISMNTALATGIISIVLRNM